MSVLQEYPARVAAILASVTALAGALVVPLANLDLTSTAGIVAGIVSVTTVVSVWLNGQKSHELSQAQAAQNATWRAHEQSLAVDGE